MESASLYPDHDTNPTETRTMTLQAFGELTGTPRGRLYDLAAKDQLPVPVHRIGTRYVLSRSLVERWLAGEYTRPVAK